MIAMEKIWHEYHDRLASFIRRRVPEHAVDDLVQDVFVKICSGIDTLTEHVKLEGWVYQITRNTVVDYYRARQATVELPSWLEHTQPEQEEDIRRELSSCLQPMIQELPDKYRRALQMSELENKTQQEVAEQENISLSGAKSRVQRGRALLRDMFTACCRFEINHRNQIVSYEKKAKDGTFC